MHPRDLVVSKWEWRLLLFELVESYSICLTLSQREIDNKCLKSWLMWSYNTMGVIWIQYDRISCIRFSICLLPCSGWFQFFLWNYSLRMWKMWNHFACETIWTWRWYQNQDQYRWFHVFTIWNLSQINRNPMASWHVKLFEQRGE